MSAGLRMGRKQRGETEREGKERKEGREGRKKEMEGGRERVGKGRDKSKLPGYCFKKQSLESVRTATK